MKIHRLHCPGRSEHLMKFVALEDVLNKLHRINSEFKKGEHGVALQKLSQLTIELEMELNEEIKTE